MSRSSSYNGGSSRDASTTAYHAESIADDPFKDLVIHSFPQPTHQRFANAEYEVQAGAQDNVSSSRAPVRRQSLPSNPRQPYPLPSNQLATNLPPPYSTLPASTGFPQRRSSDTLSRDCLAGSSGLPQPLAPQYTPTSAPPPRTGIHKVSLTSQGGQSNPPLPAGASARECDPFSMGLTGTRTSSQRANVEPPGAASGKGSWRRQHQPPALAVGKGQSHYGEEEDKGRPTAMASTAAAGMSSDGGTSTSGMTLLRLAARGPNASEETVTLATAAVDPAVDGSRSTRHNGGVLPSPISQTYMGAPPAAPTAHARPPLVTHIKVDASTAGGQPMTSGTAYEALYARAQAGVDPWDADGAGQGGSTSGKPPVRPRSGRRSSSGRRKAPSSNSTRARHTQVAGGNNGCGYARDDFGDEDSDLGAWGTPSDGGVISRRGGEDSMRVAGDLLAEQMQGMRLPMGPSDTSAYSYARDGLRPESRSSSWDSHRSNQGNSRERAYPSGLTGTKPTESHERAPKAETGSESRVGGSSAGSGRRGEQSRGGTGEGSPAPTQLPTLRASGGGQGATSGGSGAGAHPTAASRAGSAKGARNVEVKDGSVDVKLIDNGAGVYFIPSGVIVEQEVAEYISAHLQVPMFNTPGTCRRNTQAGVNREEAIRSILEEAMAGDGKSGRGGNGGGRATKAKEVTQTSGESSSDECDQASDNNNDDDDDANAGDDASVRMDSDDSDGVSNDEEVGQAGHKARSGDAFMGKQRGGAGHPATWKLATRQQQGRWGKGHAEMAPTGPETTIKKGPTPVCLFIPLFPSLPRTVAFGFDAHGKLPCNVMVPSKRPRLRLKITGICAKVVRDVFKAAGFQTTDGDSWNVLWSGALKGDDYRGFNPFQKVNHFPGTWELGRKDKMYRNVARMKRRHGAAYEFLPYFFLLPHELKEWAADCERHPDRMYIQKPTASSRGRGIRLVKRPSDVAKDKECLVQMYIRDPHLINGYKYDLRLYVAVTSFDPLLVYLHEEGLVRFATELYSSDESMMKKKCMHLTNFSINKNTSKFVSNTDADRDDVGSKWSISALKRHFSEKKIPWEPIWRQIEDIVVKTMISVEAQVNTLIQMNLGPSGIYFEIFGLDVVLDSSFRAWLIEANTGPSLSTPSPMDTRIKARMVADTLNLVGFVPFNKKKVDEQQEAVKQARLLGLHKKEGPKRRDVRDIDKLELGELVGENIPEVIMLAENEYQRRGGFERVYPTKDSYARYSQYFTTQRYNNLLYARWLEYHAMSPKEQRAASMAAKANSTNSGGATIGTLGGAQKAEARAVAGWK
eukprot:jgi/Mesvir1/19210/Mv11519-RA.4